MVDRAADETLKEALLTYAFLLTSEPMNERESQSSLSTSGNCEMFNFTR